MATVSYAPFPLEEAAALVAQGAEIIQVQGGVGEELNQTIKMLAAELSVPVVAAIPDAQSHRYEFWGLDLFTADSGPGAQGATVAAIMAGARILVTNDVRATRRTADTISELLQRRTTELPAELSNTGAS